VMSIEQIVLSIVVNAVGLGCVLVMRSAPPRLVLWVCLTTMAAVFVPWEALGTWVANLVPLPQYALTPGLLSLASEVDPSAGGRLDTSDLLLGVWLGVGITWIALALFQSVGTTMKWRSNATAAALLAQHANPCFALRVPIHRIPDSSVIATTGLFRPEIWIGDRVSDDAQIMTAINHELCHVSAGDQYTLFLIVVLERLLWWNPLIWLLGRHARRHMEYACDARCRTLMDVQSYRRSLAELFLADRAPHTALAIAPARSEVVNRLERLQITTAWSIKHAIGLAAGVAVIAVASGSLSIRAAESSDAKKAEVMRRAEAQMRPYVESGEITQTQMDARLGELEMHLSDDDRTDEDASAERLQTHEEKVAYYRRVEAEMNEVLNAGQITPAGMQERLIMLRQRLFEGSR
jgi:uncharacterized coiled-coil protein SlyX